MSSSDQPTKGPFFIVGCRRSGTSLLKSILNSHPDVFIPKETFYFDSIYPRLKNIATLESKVAYMCSRWWIKDMNVNTESLKRNIQKQTFNSIDDAMFPALLDTLNVNSCPIVGEKTPSHVNHSRFFMQTYPECKVIHIVRDPRAIVNSSIKASIGTNNSVSISKEWNDAVNIHLSLMGSAQYHFIRYEELVTNPEISIENVCDFLKIEYSRSLLDYSAEQKNDFPIEQGHHANTLRPIFSSSLDQWRSDLGAMDVRIIEKLCSRGMGHFGYQTPLTLSAVPFGVILFYKLSEIIHKNIVRRPRQYLKRVRANRRLSRQDGEN